MKPLRRRRVIKPASLLPIQIEYLRGIRHVLAFARALVHARLLPRLPELLAEAAGIKLSIAEKGIADLAKQWSAENVALIKSIPQQYFDQVEARVQRAMNNGERASDLAADIQERFNVSETRAKVIARDQIGKYNAALNRTRMKRSGIGAYIWRTVGDNRVRDEHDTLDGQRFTWDDPPSEGHPGEPAQGSAGDRCRPGEPIQCRCYPEPDIEELLS